MSSKKAWWAVLPEGSGCCRAWSHYQALQGILIVNHLEVRGPLYIFASLHVPGLMEEEGLTAPSFRDSDLNTCMEVECVVWSVTDWRPPGASDAFLVL